jgi:hypothetical protein
VNKTKLILIVKYVPVSQIEPFVGGPFEDMVAVRECWDNKVEDKGSVLSASVYDQYGNLVENIFK